MKMLDVLRVFLRKVDCLVEKNTVDYICGNGEALPLPLSAERETEMLRLMEEETECERAKAELIQHNLRLVVYIARKFENTGVDNDDLVSIGTIGLIKAINSFKMDKKIKLATYASRCIENEILMLIRMNKKHKGNINIEDVLGKDDEENEITIGDLTSDDQNNVEKLFQEKSIAEKLDILLKKYLSKREYEIICMRYGLNGGPSLPQREVAVKLGISRSYISRIETKAIDTLKNNLNKDEFEF